MELIYACEEHIDEAMDEVRNEKETFPLIKEVTDEICSDWNEDAK